jgi:hypothetical protein
LNEADGMIFQTETQLIRWEIIWWEQSSCRICIDWDGSPISRYSCSSNCIR